MPDFGLAFILNAKCANTSVKRACVDAMGLECEDDKPGRVLEYYSAEEILSVKREAGLKIVALVRNPFDRLVSFYADKICGDIFLPRWRDLGFEHNMPFWECVRIISETPPHEADQHFRPLWIDCTVKGKLIPDFYVRFESLTSDWAFVQGISRKKLPDLRRLNASTRKHWSHYYTVLSMERVRRYYHKDFVSFHYE